MSQSETKPSSEIKHEQLGLMSTRDEVESSSSSISLLFLGSIWDIISYQGG